MLVSCAFLKSLVQQPDAVQGKGRRRQGGFREGGGGVHGRCGFLGSGLWGTGTAWVLALDGPRDEAPHVVALNGCVEDEAGDMSNTAPAMT